MKDFICRMPDDVHEKLRDLSFRFNISMSEIVRNVLDDYCKKQPESIIQKAAENKNIKKTRKSKQDLKLSLLALTEPLLKKIWDNPEDDVYNDL